MGNNKLSELMKTMAARARLQKPRTNHSLCAYDVTVTLIMERSGHRSTDGVCQYERTDESQVLDVCKALSKRETSHVAPSTRMGGTSHSQAMQASNTPVFSGCTFSNCTFQVIEAPPPPQPPLADFSDTDIKELLGAACGSPYIVFISTSGMLRSSDIYI